MLSLPPSVPPFLPPSLPATIEEPSIPTPRSHNAIYQLMKGAFVGGTCTWTMAKMGGIAPCSLGAALLLLLGREASQTVENPRHAVSTCHCKPRWSKARDARPATRGNICSVLPCPGRAGKQPYNPGTRLHNYRWHQPLPSTPDQLS